MAHDPQLISRVRALYESNNLSFKRLYEDFSEISSSVASHKTIEGWASADKKKGIPWIKNRYSSLAEAIDAVVEQNMEQLQNTATDAIKNQIKGVVPAELIDDDTYLNALGENEVRKSLTKQGIVEMMEENLLDAFKLAKTSGHINTKATFQMMAKSVMESKYGKNINIGTVDISNITEEELNNMSQQELIELANDLKE